ncbi:MAG: hypothetical protein ACO29A_05260 [Ilumatobacteraceae bacterium]|jgi:hypothetical protein
MSTNQPHTPNVNNSATGNNTANDTATNDTANSDTATGTPQQLTLEGFADPRDSIDPRFILSDETCRIGRKYLAEMRRILAQGRAQAA